MISRFSSRKDRLSHVFLKDRLRGAKTYDRIAGYFRSSVFDLIHEEISTIEKVRIVCNSDLDPRDVSVAGLSPQAVAQAQLESFTSGIGQAETLLARSRWRRLHEILTSGNVEIRVVSREDAPFLHGKAGLITRPDGSTSSFVGSLNETANGWAQSYEMVWEDSSSEAAAWVQGEFDWLWSRGVPLAKAVIDEIGREARKTEIRLEALKSDPVSLIKAALVESPSRLRGESLMPWQKAFVKIWNDHRDQHASARLILADEVGVGKTLSMAATGALSVLLGDGPFLILCPATLVEQWQIELMDKLGLPSARWTRNPAKGWMDHTGHLTRARDAEDILACPCQIGIISTGLVTTRKAGEMLPEAEALLLGKFGMIALDEGHRARVKRSLTQGHPEPGNLYDFMEKMALRTRHLVIGTATPIQTHRDEIWDLMKLLAVGHEHVLGRSSVSRWRSAEDALAIISGESVPEDASEAWPYLRSPLPCASEHAIFRDIRQDLRIGKTEPFTDAALSDLDDFTRDDLDLLLQKGDMGVRLPFLRYHNPLGRHVVLRRRKTLEDAGLMSPVGLKLWPREEQNGALFENKAVMTPHYYDLAYEAVEAFTQVLAERTRAGSFLKSLLMQRICSSIEAGSSSIERMIASRQEAIAASEDEDLQEFLSGIEDVGALDVFDREIASLLNIISLLRNDGVEDPKGKAVLHFLIERDWLSHGCIIFSQYYDTARWIGSLISKELPREPVALYAGLGRSGIILDGEWRSVEREEIKSLVKKRQIRILTATDAAGEGLNLQTLGTLINVDLPWNPSRLEQRIGRIKRFGQRRSSVDMASLVYAGTVDQRILDRLSERMRDRHEILGSIPDVIEDDWVLEENEIIEKLKTYTQPPSPADMFSLRYGDFLQSVDTDWEVFEKVVARHEISDVMRKPWR